jgi:hypothetical protein
MQRRDLSKALILSATGAGLLPRPAQAQSTQPLYYPRSAAEIAAQVTPADYSHPPGSLQRYGADPTGATDSSGAWSQAIRANSHVFDDYPGGGNYLLKSEVVLSRYPITIEGCAKNTGGAGGTQLTLAAEAGPRKACLRTIEWAASIRIEKIRFAWQSPSSGQIALRFAELRSSRILDCCFLGAAAAGTTVIGIQFDGTGTYTGDVTIRDNYFSGLLIGVDLRGVCSTVRILENEMYGYVHGAVSYAVRIASKNSQTVVAFNDMEGWTRGVYSHGTCVKQIANTYEVNEHNFEWVRGEGNARIWSMSVAETFVSGGAPLYPINNDDNCTVLSGPGIADLDMTTVHAVRGFRERMRAAPLGEYATAAFTSGNFAARGGDWIVEPRQQVTFQYAYVGLTMLIHWRIEASRISGAPKAVEFTIPQFRSALQAVGTTCFIDDGRQAIGRVEVERNGKVVRICKLDDAPFATGSFTTYGQIALEIE